MTNFNKVVAVVAAISASVFTFSSIAQDDLDALLDSLDEEISKPEAKEESKESSAEAQKVDVEEPQVEEVKEESPAVEEVPAADEAVTEETPASTEEASPVEEVKDVEEVKEDLPSEDASIEEAPAAATPVAEVAAEESPAVEEAPQVVAAEPSAAIKVDQSNSVVPAADRELIENLRATEILRRQAYDAQAYRDIASARENMRNGEFEDAYRFYRNASKILNDSPQTAALRKECNQGMAEALYRAALAEDRIGRTEEARKLMEKAVDLRHPKARRQLEIWRANENPDDKEPVIAETPHRRNETDYKDKRKTVAQYLRRAQDLLSLHELDAALESCELALKLDEHNTEAIRLRGRIQQKRKTILRSEREVARDGMIADVEEAWRPVYAVNAHSLKDKTGATVKKELGVDPSRAKDQVIVDRMKKMMLPDISFRPPATISDAVDFFRTASKDYDDPALPIDERGFNFRFMPLKPLQAAASTEEDEEEGFGGDTDVADKNSALPQIPPISANNVSFYEALKQVCDSVGYKFKVQDQWVIVMHKSMSTDEMVTRNYPVMTEFLDRIEKAGTDVQELRSASQFGRDNNNAADDSSEEDTQSQMKKTFAELGVEWPEGSSIFYWKSIGKLRVKNTYDNLAELEKVLTELNVEQRLVEIEARFVEVCQEDLNSLGFEWILNSDYTMSVNNFVGKALGVKPGHYTATGGAGGSQTTTSTQTTIQNQTAGGITTGQQVINSTTTTTTSGGAPTTTKWTRNPSGVNRNIGIGAFGGTSDYQNGNRYLSTISNHISGEGYSTNDQFMRVNAFLGSADLSMILHMLSQRSDTDLLSAPKVLTKPGEEAVMKVVTEYIYPTDYDVQIQSSSSSSGNNSGSGQSAILAIVEPQSFTMREVGVILQVTPELTEEGNLINLQLNTQVVDEPTWKNYGMRIPFTGNSSLQNFDGLGDIFTGLSDIFNSLVSAIPDATKALMAEQATDSAMNALENLSDMDSMTYYDAPMEQPFFHVRSIESNVAVTPGATIVMGGLITEARKAMDDKVPFLGDLPFIGRFFRSHAEHTSKRNLLIFVTSRLVDTRGREITLSSGDETAAVTQPAPEKEAE